MTMRSLRCLWGSLLGRCSWSGMRDKLADNAISTVPGGRGFAEFVTGLILIQLLSRWLGWLPGQFFYHGRHAFREKLPMLILPAHGRRWCCWYISSVHQGGCRREMKRLYVRNSYTKGPPVVQSSSSMYLRNALLPTITVIAISFGWLISGLIVIENVFNYPGLGRLLVFAIDRRDFAVCSRLPWW